MAASAAAPPDAIAKDAHHDPALGNVEHAEGGHGHPSDARYWGIAAFLAVVTALEVAVTYTPGIRGGGAEAPLLLLGMVIKFVVVAGYFMHLKFDRPLLRNLLVTGLVLAILCYIAVLFTFRQFNEDPVTIDPRGSGIPGAQVPQAR